MLRPYLDAYLLVADRLLLDERGEDFDESAFLDECLRVGRQWVLERRLASEESLSTEMFAAALRLARHRDLFATSDPGLLDRRVAFLREIDGVRRDVESIGEIARRRDGIPGDLSTAARVPKPAEIVRTGL